MRRSLLADGCHVEEGATIENSVVGVRCRIGRNVTIRNSIVMGCDFYQSPDEIAANVAAGLPPLGIGENTLIEGAIVDKNCRIGRNARVVNEQGVESLPETPEAVVAEGIIVLPKDAMLRDGWRLG